MMWVFPRTVWIPLGWLACTAGRWARLEGSDVEASIVVRPVDGKGVPVGEQPQFLIGGRSAIGGVDDDTLPGSAGGPGGGRFEFGEGPFAVAASAAILGAAC